MKKYAYLAVASSLLLAAGCNAVLEGPAVSDGEAFEVELIADFEAPASRTVREADGSVLWVAGDEISLFFGEGEAGGSRFTTSAGGASASFRGELTSYTAGGEDYNGGTTYFWGIYPYDSLATCDNTSVTTTLHSEQTGVADTFSPGQNVSVGRAENLLMSFFNVCTGFKFSLTRDDIVSVTFSSIGGEQIVGDIRVTMEDGTPAATVIGNGSSEITLTPENGHFSAGVSYYIEFIPKTLASGFTVSLYTDTQMGEFTYNNSREFLRRVFTNVSNIDTRISEWVTRPGIPVEDANFKAYLVANFDTNGDGEISYEEAEVITRIDVSTVKISSMQGIECMPNLNSLTVSGSSWDPTTGGSGKLTVLDVSKNTALAKLDCSFNQLINLDVSKNTALTELDCSFNQLTSLNASTNTTLIKLDCSRNQLTSLDVSKNASLTHLSCGYNQLTSLDVSKNTALTHLSCSSNQLASLDVSKNTALTRLYCFSNQLTSLNLSKNTALTYLDCSPMYDASGHNLLALLYVHPDQSIEGVTVNRSADRIPDGTRIMFSSYNSGIPDLNEGEWNWGN